MSLQSHSRPYFLNSDIILRLLKSRVFLCAISIIIGSITTYVFFSPKYERFEFLYNDFTIEDCAHKLLSGQETELVGLAQIKLYNEICYDRIHSQGLLNEFRIRRVNFQNQHIAENVIMWTVVALTISGVLLAGYQIINTPNTLDSPKNKKKVGNSSEFRIEKGKVSLRSSVTGLFILLFSFAFFYVYIIYVYTIRDIGDNTHNTNNMRGATIGNSIDIREFGSGLLITNDKKESTPE